MKASKIFQGDMVIWVIFFFLCVISLVEVFSAASTLAYKDGSFWSPLIKQAAFLAGGTLVVIFFHNIPCRFFKLIPIIFLPLSVILLLITLLFGNEANDASRWIGFGFFQFQPSEIAKVTVIASVALVLAQQQRQDGADDKAFKYTLIIVGVICALIFTENLSTAALLFGVVFLMMFIGRVKLILLGKLILGIIGGLGLIILIAAISPKDSAIMKSRIFHRFQTWESRIDKQGEDIEKDAKTYRITDKTAQRDHANIAIATSGFIGKMPGNSVQRDFLSQAYSDFIFAIIIEELGLWGAAMVVFLYIVLLFRAGRIASRCERNFPAFLAMGLALLLVSQAILNMMVATGLFPITGQPLPLISRGGTATLINCTYIGMILSVSRYSRKTLDHSDPFVKVNK